MKLTNDVNLGFTKNVSLSCIESYLIFIFRSNKMEYRYLFGESYCSFFDIAKAFIADDVKYAFFYRIPRLQDTAYKLGVIDIKSNNCGSFQISPFNLDYSFYLFKVNQQFINSQLKFTPWREDHYIYLKEYQNGRWIYVSEFPQKIGTLTSDELLSYYDGTYIKIDLLCDHFRQSKISLLNTFISDINKQQKTYHFSQDIDALKVRDLLGILRVSRRRISEFLSMFTECDFADEYLHNLDQQYAMVEYMRLRNIEDYSKLSCLLMKIQKKDIEFTIKLRKVVQGLCQ